jgi:DNA-directed RNA polymerase subunit RPC12/RpoP
VQHQKRFLDDGNYLSSYAGEVHVRCIRCNAAGVVLAERSGWHWVAAFKCATCGLQLDSAQRDWVGPISLTGRRPCGHCGHKWLQPRITQTSWPREVLRSTSAACTECGRESVVQLGVHRLREMTVGKDPHFGLALLLADAGRHGAVWAYNAQHLKALMAYVQASLRERGVNSGNGSMFSRLPAWLKSAKNRGPVSRRLAKLERLLPNPSIERTPDGAAHVER